MGSSFKILALKCFFLTDKGWVNKGDIIETSCYNCIERLIREGKAKRLWH